MPLILWASLWAHPRSAAHALSYLPLRRLYRSADAVVTYGPHVSAYVRARGARNVHVAPQSVDNDFWSAPEVAPPSAPAGRPAPTMRFLFVGRAAREKGLAVLVEAWRAAGCSRRPPRSCSSGVEPASPAIAPAGRAARATRGSLGLDAVGAGELRDVYAACDVLVCRRSPRARFASRGAWSSTRR